MIVEKDTSLQYLLDVRDGKIPEGLGLGSEFIDGYMRFKRGQMNMILGGDNVGKSYWFQWYALALSTHHNIKWTLWMGEDEVGETMINLVQMLSGKNFFHLQPHEIKKHFIRVENWFTFVDPSNVYTPDELLTLFKESNSDAFLIDPYTGLKRGYGHTDNYDFLNTVREFCNTAKKTVYISLHPSSESQRVSGQWGKGHSLEGYQKPPKKADAEGGQPFANRADDFLIIHRYAQHELFSEITEVHVRKNKRNRTGGKQTLMEHPIKFDFNRGLGFLVNGRDLINRPDPNKLEQQREIFAQQEAQNKQKQDEFLARVIANKTITPDKGSFGGYKATKDERDVF